MCLYVPVNISVCVYLSENVFVNVYVVYSYVKVHDKSGGECACVWCLSVTEYVRVNM